MELCDASADGTETAKVIVYTKHGPLMFCNHHFVFFSGAFMDNGYPAEAIVEHNDNADLLGVG